MKLREAVSWLTGTLQRNLIPRLEECGERPLTEKERQLVSILELVHNREICRSAGRKIRPEALGTPGLARAFVGKAVYNHPHTRATIEALRSSPVFRRLCGFLRPGDIPSEATFSRAFGEFARQGLGERVHEALVARYVKLELVGHISRDATAIRGREKPRARGEAAQTGRKKGAGGGAAPKPETRLERQCRQSAAAALAELPVHCDVEAKKNSKGYKQAWIAYTLNVDVNDCGLPISAVLTAASLHEIQVAVPLMKMTSERTVAKRFNSQLQEGFGAGNVMVRGAAKVRLHLLLGGVALLAVQLRKLIS